MATKKVYTRLAERMKEPGSPYLLKILQKIMTPEEGELLMALPASTPDLAKKFNKTEAAIKKTLKDLLHRGLIIATVEGYTMPGDSIMLHDTTLASDDEVIDPEVNKLWKDWYDAGWSATQLAYWTGNEGPRFRIIPAHRAIKKFKKASKAEVLPFEDPAEIIKGAQLIAIRRCSCKTMTNCPHTQKVCFQFNNAGEATLGRPSGKKLSTKEAIELLDACEEEGLVHLIRNRIAPVNTMCNCCGDACVVINSGIKHGKLDKPLTPSRYRASVDTDKCKSCQTCVEVCNFGAIVMEKPAGDKKYKSHVIPEKCYGCGICYIKCKSGAISFNQVRKASHIPVTGEKSEKDEWQATAH